MTWGFLTSRRVGTTIRGSVLGLSGESFGGPWACVCVSAAVGLGRVGGRVERPAVLGGPLVLVDVVVWGARSPFRVGHRRRVQDRPVQASRSGVRRPALRW